MMDMDYNRKLSLEDGAEYYGFAFRYTGDKVLEIVFNTSFQSKLLISSVISLTKLATG